jgi:quercetin dioxygenase-like cupin family protein
MAIPHAQPAEAIDIRPLGNRLATAKTTTLVKTDSLEVIRLVLPAGKDFAPHTVAGEITLQCLEGEIEFHAGDSHCVLAAGHLVYLRGSVEHSLRADVDSSLLLTILLSPRHS